MVLNAATTAPKGESDNRSTDRLIGTACAMTRNGNNDTSVLNASPHWTARHQYGESANFTVKNGKLAL